MTDLVAQTRDYLEMVRTEVTVDSIVTHPVAPIAHRRGIRRGPLVALATAVVAVLVGLVGVLLQPKTPEIARSEIVNEVIKESQEDSHYVVGFDRDGILCAETGASDDVSRQSQSVCGDSDQPAAQAYQRTAATAYQGDAFVALAGWVPASAASVTAVYNNEIQRTLELTPIPGYDLFAFGAIEEAQARLIEIQVRNATGEIIEHYYPSIGPSD